MGPLSFCRVYKHDSMGVPKLRGTFLGVPIIRIIVRWVYIGFFWGTATCSKVFVQLRASGYASHYGL